MAVVNTNLNYSNGGDPPFNIPTEAPIAVDQNTFTIEITPGFERLVQLVGDAAWNYMATSGGDALPVAAGQVLIMLLQESKVIYYTRSAGDGTMVAMCLQ